MRKGERRRRDIIAVSERLFLTRGYEATTIQDILNELRLSKGGFYHHFLSKEELLEAICEDKAEQSFQAAHAAVLSCPGSAVDQLNAMFDKNGIWQEEQVDFLGMLIRVAYHDHNLMMREKLKMANLTRTLPLFNDIIAKGVADGVFFSPYPDAIGLLILQLGLNLTDEIASMLAQLGEDPPDMVRVLERLELYRHAIEKLLDAPFGSIVIFQMRRMAEICQAIWENHLRACGLHVPSDDLPKDVLS